MFFEQILQHAIVTTSAALSSPSGILALVAGAIALALVVAGSFVRTMLPLRWLAVASNIGFIIFGALYPSLPMLTLQALVLPINIYRAAEMIRMMRRVDAAAAARDTSGLWLRPFMKRHQLAAGEVLFRKGDRADHLYMLTDGQMELVEIGAMLTPGRLFGEIAFFAPDRHRTLTARCVEPCQLLSIDESDLRQLYTEHPDFGFELIGLVAARLHADVRRLENASAAAAANYAAADAAAGVDNRAVSSPPPSPAGAPEGPSGLAQA